MEEPREAQVAEEMTMSGPKRQPTIFFTALKIMTNYLYKFLSVSFIVMS